MSMPWNTRFPWTPEIKAEAIKMFLGGESAAQIARKLAPEVKERPTRSAVLGMLNRAGIGHDNRRASYPPNSNRTPLYTPPTCRPKPVKVAAPPLAKVVKPAPAPKPAPRLVIGGHGAVTIHEQREPVVAPPKARAFTALPGTKPLPFEDRPRNGCNWPITREGDDDGISRLACCAPRAEGFSLCATHFTMANAQHLTPAEARARASKARPARNLDFFDQSILRRRAGSARISA